MKNLTDSRKSVCGKTDRFALKSCLRKINEFEQSGRFELG